MSISPSTTPGPEHVTVAVLGGGSAGEQLAQTLAEDGVSVAIIEKALVGGECPFYACIPSKSMLRTAAVRHTIGIAHEIGAVDHAVDLGDGADAFRRAAERRDDAADHQDDTEHVQVLRDAGVTVIRGTGTITGPGEMSIDSGDAPASGRTLAYDHLVIATGSGTAMPDVGGLAEADPWTFEDAWTATDRPQSMLVMGGGPVGMEIAQTYAAFGSRVILVDTDEVLGGQAEPEVAEDLTSVLCDVGVDVRTGTGPDNVTSDDRGHHVAIDGEHLTVEVIVVATGKVPNTAGLGLETLGLDPDDVRIDARCQVEGTDNVWAIGDVTAEAPFTHTANYQGRIAAANIMGRHAEADYRAIPRTVYTSPEVASVGMTRAMAEDDGINVVSIAFDLADTARGSVDHDRAGRLVLVADRARNVLIGASLVAPAAGEAINEFSLAIRAEVPLGVLGDLVHAFPTWSEGFGPAIAGLMQAATESN